MDEEKKIYPSRWYVLLLFAAPLSLYFWFGLQHLSQFEAADEHFWISEDTYNINTKETIVSRIPSYWTAMRAKDWKDTDINDKPGITLAMVSGLGQYLHKGWADRIVQQNKYSQIYDPQKTLQLDHDFRLPILVFNGIMLVYMLTVLKRLLRNNWTSLIAASLIALCPVLIGVSQIINPDALLWTFAISSLLTFMLFVQKRKWWDAIFASILLGFAFLSKYTAVILIPFFFALMLAQLFFAYRTLEEEKKVRRAAFILSLAYPLIIAGGVLVFALGLPAVFADHNVLWDGVNQIAHFRDIMLILMYADAFLLADAVILKSWIVRHVLKYAQYVKKILPQIVYAALAAVLAAVVVNWGMKHNILNVPMIDYDARDKSLFANLPWQHKVGLELFPFVFSLTPLALAGIFIAWVKNIFKYKEEDQFVLFSLSCFFIAFYAGVILQNLQVNVRYSVLLYAPAMVIAAIGIAPMFNSFSRIRFNNLCKIIPYAGIIALSAWSVWLIKPFYFNYATDILPKEYVISGGWGYGAAEAAEYINGQMDDPRNLNAWTDYEGFCPFFAGRCYKGSQIKWNKDSDVDNIDYYVTSRRGMMLSDQMWANLADNHDEKPVWELDIDGRPGNFIRVYKNILKTQ